MRPRGGIIAGSLPTWTTTATSGVFTLREAQEMRASAQWPRGPVAPTSLTAAPGNAQLSLSWTAPATTHGGTITNYLVEYTASGGSAAYVLTGSTSTSYTLTGLTNGTAYTVRVAAVNFTAGDYATTTATPVSVNISVNISSETYAGVTYSWSGSGTVASPLQTNGPPAPDGPNWDTGFPNRLWYRWTFTAGASGTVTVRYGGRENEGAEIPDFFRYVKNNVITSSFTGAATGIGSHQAQRSFLISSGDVFSFGNSGTNNGFRYYEPYGQWQLWIS
jgi:hypothetical protein